MSITNDRHRLFDWRQSYVIHRSVSEQLRMQRLEPPLSLIGRCGRAVKLDGAGIDTLVAFARRASPEMGLQNTATTPSSTFVAILEFLVGAEILVSTGAPHSRSCVDRSSSKGVLIFALDHPSYGLMAYPLAASLKAGNPDVPLALVYSDGAIDGLNEGQRRLFSHIIHCPREYRSVDGRAAPLYAKAHSDLLSPFDETIVVDADSMMFPDANIATEFARYDEEDFAAVCTAVHRPSDSRVIDNLLGWVPVADILSRYGIARPIHDVHAYYYYFKKTKTASYFEQCRRMFLDLNRKPIPRMRYWWHDADGLGFVSVEMVMAACTGLVDMRIHPGFHRPIVEDNLMPRFRRAEVESDFIGFTFCSPQPNTAWLELYQSLAVESCRRIDAPPATEWPGKPLRGQPRL